MNFVDLNKRILSAHASEDGNMLARLYGDAGTQMLAAGQVDEGCFFLTQAYVFALENGLDSAEAFHGYLVEHGREK